tara:strand:+ start:620 stop:946 length:327 start_codon:yes stop_codon:yes gene_type:complete
MRSILTELKTIILDAIRLEDDYNTHWSEKEAFAYALNAFISSHDWEIKRYGILKACTNWFLGLGLSVPYMNYDIEQLGHDPETYWQDLADCFLQETLEISSPYSFFVS